METKIVCPLGCECERVVDDHVERCAWYVTLEGEDPQNGERINTSKCAIAWQPILMVENSGKILNVAAGIDSLRNETIKRQDIALGKINGLQIPSDT